MRDASVVSRRCAMVKSAWSRSLPERAHAFPMRISQAVATSPAIGVYPAEVDKTSNNITPEFRDSVGRDHRDAYEKEVPALLRAALVGAKKVFDPAGVMNPGVLFSGS